MRGDVVQLIGETSLSARVAQALETFHGVDRAGYYMVADLRPKQLRSGLPEALQARADDR
jgi:hypothetical protein